MRQHPTPGRTLRPQHMPADAGLSTIRVPLPRGVVLLELAAEGSWAGRNQHVARDDGTVPKGQRGKSE